MRIFSLGSLNIDYVYQVSHFVRPGETLASRQRQVFPGGKGLNQSVALARAGAQVVHGAVLGADGGFLRQVMEDAGVDVARLRQGEGPSGHAIIQVDEKGQNCILLFAGTNHQLTEDYLREFLADARPGDLLLMQNETNGIAQAFRMAKEKGMGIAFNPSPFTEQILSLPLELVDLWFCNEIEGAALCGVEDPEEIAERFRKQFPQAALVLTLGSEGSLYRDAGGLFRQARFAVEAVDTTAAGDTFTGFFLAAIAQGMTVQTALRRAAYAAALAVSRPGASVSIPTKEEITV